MQDISLRRCVACQALAWCLWLGPRQLQAPRLFTCTLPFH